MIVANFSGGEAEELRRAMECGARGKNAGLETKLRRGMVDQWHSPGSARADCPIHTSFAGVWISRNRTAASFCAHCHASAYLKCHYLAAFTAATEQSADGFYQPFHSCEDAQLHGLRVKPVDVLRSVLVWHVGAMSMKPVIRMVPTVCHAAWDCSTPGDCDKRRERLWLRTPEPVV